MAAQNQPIYSHDRRDETATPMCGAHRGNRANPLLTKTQLGGVKATSYDLPSNFQYTYGKQQPRDGLTAGTVIDNWAEHSGTHDVKPPRDFRALNKAAICAGNLDSKAVREYSKTHDMRVKLGGQQKKTALPIDENTTFGKTVRPSTPFGDLVSHGFRYDWVMQSELAENVVQKMKPKKPQPTKASQATAACAQATIANKTASDGMPQAEWKMKKFANVKAKVSNK